MKKILIWAFFAFTTSLLAQNSSGSTLPTSAPANVGDKFYYTPDSSEATYAGSNYWLVNLIKGSSTPPLKQTISGQTFDYSRAIWKRGGLSVIGGQTIDHTYQNQKWDVYRGYYTLNDFGTTVGADISDALNKALASTSYLKIQAGVYHIDNRISIFKDSIEIEDEANCKSVFLWNGGFDKMFHIKAKCISFKNIVFDGNFKEVKSSLVYISPSSTVSFIDCTFKNIRGKHADKKYNNDTNKQYAVQCPKNDVSISFNSCNFLNIKNENLVSPPDTTPYEGVGFCGAFYLGDSADVDSMQLIKSYLTFNNCKFSDIQTILPSGLTEAQKITYDDGDAIRFYSNFNTDKVYTNIDNCTFENISKRAIKVSDVSGVNITNCVTTESNLPYPMTTCIKVGNGTNVSNLTVFCNQTPYAIFQSHTSNNISINQVKVNKCQYFYLFTPLYAKDKVSNISIDKIIVDTLYNQFNQQSLAIDSIKNFTYRNIFAKGFTNTTRGFQAPFTAQPNATSYVAQGLDFTNCYLKYSAGGVLDNISLTIDNPTFGGLSNSLIEDDANSVTNVSVKIKSISPTFKTDSRFFYYSYGENEYISNLTLKVDPSVSNVSSKYELVFYNKNSHVTGINYMGVGRCALGYPNPDANPAKNNFFTNIQRANIGVLPTLPFLDSYIIENCTIKDITDKSLFSGNYVTSFAKSTNTRCSSIFKMPSVFKTRPLRFVI